MSNVICFRVSCSVAGAYISTDPRNDKNPSEAIFDVLSSPENLSAAIADIFKRNYAPQFLGHVVNVNVTSPPNYTQYLGPITSLSKPVIIQN